MSEQKPLRVAIIGTGKRSDYLYAPLICAMPEHVQLVAVWGRREAPARQLGEQLNVPWFTDISKLVADTDPEIGIVSVSYAANGEVGLMAVESGLNVLLETPIAHDLKQADAIIAAAQQRGLKIEVAEQFHRRPHEQIKLKLLESGLFGRVHTSFSDFAGHGYHGISVMRSYLGFDARPVRVTGLVREYPLTAHRSILSGSGISSRNETQEHGTVEFEGGQTGIYHWTSVGYDSALRWWRSSRFLAEKGMGISIGTALDFEERLSLLSADLEAPGFISIERRYERVDGGSLTGIYAHTGDSAVPLVGWDNPFRPKRQGHGAQWHDDEIGVAGCLLSLVSALRTGGEPTYGPYQARVDQELVLAIRKSSENNSQPVQLPLELE
jgi:predicted dehydrogenase